MINYRVENTHTFHYWSDENVNVNIIVVEKNIIVYITELSLVKDISFFTSLFSGWNDKKVIITNKNTGEEITFNMLGDNSILSEEDRLKYRKYVHEIRYVNNTELCHIMDKHGSDKGSKPINSGSAGHNYTRYYNDIFNKFKFDEINFFELGLGTNNINIESNMGENGVPGASIFGWCEYFPNANVFGADIDTGCLFETDKIKTFYCDQTNPKIVKQMWDNKYLDFKFDIIIEDGLHTYDANITFFENSIHKLKKHGIYIIEDINNDEIINWLNKFEEYENKYPQLNFKLLLLECDHNVGDNNLIKITYKNE